VKGIKIVGESQGICYSCGKLMSVKHVMVESMYLKLFTCKSCLIDKGLVYEPREEDHYETNQAIR